MGSHKHVKDNRKLLTCMERKQSDVDESSNVILRTLLPCSFVKAHVSGQSLQLNLKVDPEEYGSHYQIFSAFVHGYVTCETVSAKVIPVEGHESCNVCGGMLPRQETVLSFTIGARNLRSDCNVCHDHGSLCKYRKCGNMSFHRSDDAGAGNVVREEASTAVEDVEDVEDVELTSGETSVNTDEKESTHSSVERNALTTRVVEKDVMYIDNEDEDWKMGRILEGGVSGVELDEDQKKKTNINPQKKTEDSGESKGEKKINKNTQTCKTCGRLKSAEKECVFCQGNDDDKDDDWKMGASVEESVSEDELDGDQKQKTEPKCQNGKLEKEGCEWKINKTTDNTYVCETCGMRKKSAEGKCSFCPDGTEHHKCKSCKKSFDSVSSLETHELTCKPASRFACSECGVTFKRNYNLTRHIKCCHEDVKDYKCDVCDKRYFAKFELQIHNLSHTHKCNTCGKHLTPACGKQYLKCDFCADVKRRQCKNCEQRFDSVLLLNEHKPLCEAKGQFPCSQCGATFARKYNLLKHKKWRHGGVRDFKCDICDKSYFEKSQLIVHKRSHTGERPYQCDTCGKSFASPSGLRVHRKFHNKKMHKCHVCEKTFFCKSYLKYHQSLHVGKNDHVCPVCSVDCSTNVDLQKHILSHRRAKSFQCDECPKAFFCQTDLQIHQRVHTGERPFKCTLCEKTFTMESSLKKHVQSHSTERPYKCEVCHKDFVTRLQRHCHMKHHKEKKFVCEICGKRFLDGSGLRSHETTHTGEKKHICEFCGKRYRNITSLKNHRKTHTGENLLQCHKCGDWFTDPSYFKLHQKKFCKGDPLYCEICGQATPHQHALNSHMGIHTGERPFGCKICGKAFSKPESLSEHEKRHEENPNFRCSDCGKCFINANELRKHAARHSRVKKKALLPENLKPGKRDIFDAVAVSQALRPETQSSTRVEVEKLGSETKQAAQTVSSGGTEIVIVKTNRVTVCNDNVEEVIHAIDLRPKVQFTETSGTSNIHQVNVSRSSTSSGIMGEKIVPPTGQNSHILASLLQKTPSGHEHVMTSRNCEKVETTDYEK